MGVNKNSITDFVKQLWCGIWNNIRIKASHVRHHLPKILIQCFRSFANCTPENSLAKSHLKCAKPHLLIRRWDNFIWVHTRPAFFGADRSGTQQNLFWENVLITFASVRVWSPMFLKNWPMPCQNTRGSFCSPEFDKTHKRDLHETSGLPVRLIDQMFQDLFSLSHPLQSFLCSFNDNGLLFCALTQEKDKIRTAMRKLFGCIS